MITRDLIITVNDDVSVLNEPITLYRGDRGITLNCKIVQYKFQFMRTTDGNVITGTNIINARVLVHKPDGNGCFEVPLAKVKDDIVVVPISADWLDEISEIGTYRLQIQLYGEDPAQQRVTIPPIEFTVRDTLCDINENFSDIAGYALTDTSAIKLKGDSYNADLNNGYTPTIWVTGDIITSTSLNKMEEAIEYSVDKVNAINGVEDNDKVDYMGNHHTSLKNKADADVEYILGEVNTVHYEGQHITATDTIERQVKSAVFKGQTLVNLAPKFNDNRWIKNGSGIPSVIKTDDYVEINVTSAGSAVVEFKDMTLFKLNTDYTFIINILENTFSSVALTDFSPVNKSLATGCNKFKLTSNGSTDLFIRIGYTGHLGANSKLRISNIVVLEGDYTNVDIPYFEGMASVNAPTVKTVGKNLFEIKNAEELSGWGNHGFELLSNGVAFHARSGWNSIGYRFPSLRNKTVTVTADVTFNVLTNNKNLKQEWGIGNKAYIPQKTLSNNMTERAVATFTLGSDGIVWLFGSSSPENTGHESSDVKWSFTNVQVEEGSTATAYTQPKLSFLKLPEEVVLRSLPDGTKDTLNLATGEYIQRIGEVIKDNANGFSLAGGGWETKANVCTFEHFKPEGLRPQDANNHPTLNCDKFSSCRFATMWGDSKGIEGITQHASGQIVISIDRKKLTTQNSNGLNSYLKLNPITIQYRLETPIVKTIDLNNQKVYSYDGTTHYTTASAENHPVPTLSIDVPTNLPALVSRQRATIQALTVENQEIKAVNEAQDTDIALNQEAINFMLFQSTSMMLSEQTKGINPMSTYLANQIIKGKLSYDLVVEKYEDFKEDIDIILMDKRGEELDKLNK